MLVAVDVPVVLSPHQLDAYLARGWFRAGSAMFRTRVLCLYGGLHGVMNVRVRLREHGLSRSQRRIVRLGSRFRIEIGSIQVDAAHEHLYAVTKERFSGFVYKTLEGFLFSGVSGDMFDTREVRVLDGDRLIAVSYFDLGHRTMASILGLYDPDYARFSLGIYTMLLEIDYAKQLEMTHYYPGYVLQGYPGFDYKLGLGNIQYFDWKGRWRPVDRMPRSTRLVERMERRVRTMEAALRALDVPFERRLYPWFWLGHVDTREEDYLSAAIHLECHPRAGLPATTVIEYLAEEDVYVLSRVAVHDFDDAWVEGEPSRELCDPGVYTTDVLVIERRLAVDRSEEALARAAADLGVAPISP